jgi:hypothetical protein
MPGRIAQGARLGRAALFAAFAASAAQAGPLDPGAKLCMYPLSVPLDEKSGAERRAAIERQLVAGLEAAAFEVADPAAVRALWERVHGEVGATIDPVTGERDPARHAEEREKLARGLAEELGCDAQLVASVVIVRALFFSGNASWDGTKQQVSSTGRQLLNALAGAVESGWVNAFSLWLRVLDLNDDEIAFRSAGIETPMQLAVKKDEDLVPEDRWLLDAARIDAAILSALGPGGSALRERGSPGSPPSPPRAESPALR